MRQFRELPLTLILLPDMIVPSLRFDIFTLG